MTNELMMIRSRGSLIRNGRDLYPEKDEQLFGLNLSSEIALAKSFLCKEKRRLQYLWA